MYNMITMNCLAKDRHNKCCRNKQIHPTFFCKFHQYMCEYTPDMLERLELCKGCKKMYYLGESIKMCENCRTRDKTKYKKEIVLCKKEGCTFKKSDENEFCGKHQICLFIKDTIHLGKKVCQNYIRGCKSQLEGDYLFSKCKDCLETDRATDKAKREQAKELNQTMEETHRICSVCCIQYDISQFKGIKTHTKTCQKCRDQNKKQDKLRDKEKRNVLAKTNIHQSFRSYIKEAGRRNIEFQLEKDVFCDIVKKNCYYCGEINEEKKFNGVDRSDSTQGYFIENCVSCCSLCNYLKHKMSVETFLKRIQHIVSYHTEKERMFLEHFPDFISGNYKQYSISAKNRDIDFSLSEKDFQRVTKESCYMCGKENSEHHRNGIDRFDNSVGYIVSNCKSCCNTCNMMKNRFSYEDVMNKFNKITEKRERG